MSQRKHVQNEIVIQSSQGEIWEILEDTSLLPRWIPMVKSVTGNRESLNAQRSCHVEMQGRRGEVVEHCAEFSPQRSIGWVMDRDTLGFSRMFSHTGFRFILEPRSASETLVRMEAEYEPRGFFGRLMYALMMGRKLGRLREQILKNLKGLAEGSSVTA